MPKLCTYFCFFLPSLSPLLLAQDSILDVIPDLSAEAQDSFFAHYDGSKGVASANGGVSSWTPVDLNGNSLPSFRLDAFSTGGVDSGGASPSDIIHDGDTLIFTDSSDPAQTRRLQLDLESGLFTESSVIWQGQYDSGGFFENSGSYAFNLGPNQSSHQRDDDGGEGFNIELFRGSTTYIGESISMFDGNTTNWTTIATETGHTAFANNINLNVGETPTPTPNDLPDSSQLIVGAFSSSGFDFVGEMKHLILFQTALSEADRVLINRFLNTTVVTNSNPEGPGSLRAALANAADTIDARITFDPTLSGSIIRLGGSELLIDRSLTIDASNLPEGIIIDGGGDDFVQDIGESRCIRVSDGSPESAINVTLNNLTLQNGSFEGQDAGANLFNDGEDVILINCQILDGHAFVADSDVNFVRGGGILNLLGNLRMENCTVSGNQVQAGSSTFGGGIYSSSGALTMLNCAITGNQAQGGDDEFGQGGGIYSFSSSLTMENCSIADNRTQGGEAQGGGIYSEDRTGAPTTLTRCTLSGNSAPDSQGGGLFNNRGSARLTHCTVTENAGGGLASSGSQFTVTNVTASLVAANSGGDIVFVDGEINRFTSGGSNLIGDGNAVGAFDAEGDQTGITDPRLAPLADNGGPTLTHLPLPDSPAVDAASGSGSFNDQRGFPVDALVDIGAVELQQARVDTLAGGNTSDDDDSISLRQAIEQFDPAPFDLITFDPNLSGSIIRLGGSELLIDRSLTIDASNLSEGIIIDGGGSGNFVQEEGESRCIQISDGDFLNAITVTLNNLTLRNGSFEGGNAGANLFNNGEDVTLINCQILDGRAFSDATTTGGGIANLSGNLTMENCTVCGNQIEADQALGGGIYSTTGSLNLLNCFITGNQTEGMPGEFALGGGICTVFSDLTMENCSITNNRTLGGIAQGGGIFSDTGFGQPTMLTRCTLSGNSAPGFQGGGLFNDFGQTILSHCTVTENTGGGLASFGDNANATTVTASVVAANSGGDIVFINGGTNPFTSGGSNLIGDGNAVAAFNAGGDQIGITDPRLAPLADNGGPTLTHLPLFDSLAIDTALDSESSTDQRGFPVDALADIGAVELQQARVNTLADGDTSDDDNSTSLRQATEQFEPVPFELITFDPNLSGSIIRLGGSELLIDRSLTIDASNLSEGIIIDGGGDEDFVQEEGESRCIQISDGDFLNAITVTLNNLTLRNGSVSSNNGGANLFNNGEDVTLINCQIVDGRAFSNTTTIGGGILNIEGNLTMENCTVSGNQIEAEQALGGGIFTRMGNLTMLNCSITDNRIQGVAGGFVQGGGIFTFSGDLTMENCSITNNRTEGDGAQGGGIFSDVASGQTTTLTRCTLSGNSAPNSQGGGLFNNSGQTILTQCTVTENTAGSNAGGGLASSGSRFTFTNVTASIVAANSGGDILFINGEINPFTSGGSNLIGDGNAVGAFNAGGDQTGMTDPRLAPLADNGGPTLTHLPLPSSLAIDGASGSESTIDQRGLPINDSSPDVGSVERQNFLEGFEQIFDEDVDGDGTSVGVELAIGTDPFRPDAGDERNLRILPFDSSGELQLTFGVDDDAQSEILLRLTRSINLIDFDEILSNQVNDFEGPVIFSDPNPPEGQAFYRLEAIGLNLTN